MTRRARCGSFALLVARAAGAPPPVSHATAAATIDIGPQAARIDFRNAVPAR